MADHARDAQCQGADPLASAQQVATVQAMESRDPARMRSSTISRTCKRAQQIPYPCKAPAVEANATR